MMDEIWKPVPGYEGFYEASTTGKIRSIGYTYSGTGNYHKRQEPRILKGSKDKNGYIIQVLCLRGTRKTYKEHRLIASTFIPNPNNYEQINHKDENVVNNSVDNLEWCTSSYNNNYGKRRKRLSESLRNNPKKSKPVIQLDMDRNFVARYPSAKEAQRQTHICNISCACNRSFRHLTSGGYIWEWEDNYKQLNY